MSDPAPDAAALCRQLNEAASETAEVVLRVASAHAGAREASVKPDGSLVTEADHAIERALAGELRQLFPSSDFHGEEGQAERRRGASVLWTVDPIDGTTNYVAGIPYWAAVVAAECGGHVEFGCVAMPTRGLCAYARRGHGAVLLTSEGPSILSVREPRTRLFLSYPYVPDRPQAPRGLKLRALGSSGSDLALVAMGWAAGALSAGWSVWDVLGAVLVVEEAGYEMVALSGDPVTADAIARGAIAPGTAFATGPPGKARQWAEELSVAVRGR
jgi:myo-inositol-1(or 4)-monophosphatase